MIQRWNIMHLPRRRDKETVALAAAVRFGVPLGIVRFWTAMDAVDFDNSPEAIRDAAVHDGFPEFGRSIGNVENPGFNCQMWNICRFLRDLAVRDSVEMLIHDGMVLRELEVDFFPDFEWLCEIVVVLDWECRKVGYPFLVLGVGHQDNPRMPVNLLHPGSFIARGAVTQANSIRVYSSAGAERVLHRILSHPNQFRESYPRADRLWEWTAGDLQPFGHHWAEPGVFTGISRQIAVDLPSAIFGSDTVTSLKAQQGTGMLGDLFPNIPTEFRGG